VTIFRAGLIALWWSTAGAAPNLSGAWLVQTLGSDREVKIEQTGSKFVARRVLWPEFEGKRYRLDHLYRGIIHGNSIAGQLLIKEEGEAKFEVLRDFAAQVNGADVLILDSLLIKRAESAQALSPDEAGKPDIAAGRAADAPALF
jgi:hypothetical protein